MLVFYVNINVFGLNFKRSVIGQRSDYTAEELYEIKERFKKDIKRKLFAMGYIG